MANKSLRQKVLALSPHIEMMVRKIYWDNIERFAGKKKKKKKRKRKRKKKKPAPSPVEFQKLLDTLSADGIGPGSLLVVHSSYGELKRAGKLPQQIIDALRELIGPEGTLAMPAIRRYADDPDVVEFVTKDMSNVTATYDVRNSKVWTGLLPKVMLSQPGAVISRFPLNSMVAVGPLAEPMMEDNLKSDGLPPLPNGVNSSWNFCAQNNAFVVGLGIDLTHSLTMIHVAEDVKDQEWPVKDWYRERKFNIVDGDFETSITVRERQPKWGCYKFAERTLCKDLIRKKILNTHDVDGITVETLRSKDLIDFLNSKNQKGYPYFWV